VKAYCIQDQDQDGDHKIKIEVKTMSHVNREKLKNSRWQMFIY